MQEADAKLKELRGLFERLQGEVEGENFWRCVPSHLQRRETDGGWIGMRRVSRRGFRSL
jgi:hypothetical protein